MKPKIDLAEAVHGAARPASGSIPVEADRHAKPDRASTRQGKKGVLIHVAPELWRRLRQLALDENTTVQSLGVEAFESLLRDRRATGLES